MRPALAPLRLFERAAVILLLCAAFVPRVRGLTGGFDREFDGFQGAFFTMCALNYERLGLERLGGYPTIFVDIAEDFDTPAYVYANHPPTVPYLALLSLKAFGPPGWSAAWRAGRAPAGVEPVVRAPFLLLHMLGLAAFWWMARQASGPRPALLALALLAMSPISIAYAQLVNYENPSLPWVFLAFGCTARRLRGLPGRNLAGAALAFSAATAVTFGPLFFLPPLVLLALAARGAREAWRAALALGAAAALPIAAHGLWVRLALPDAASSTVLERAAELLAPLFTGEAPLGEWLRRQTLRSGYFLTWPALLAALAGLILGAAALLGRGKPAPAPGAPLPPVAFGATLLLGGLLYLLAFYRHTFDGAGLHDGQTIFLINLAPGVALSGAAFLDALAAPLGRLRGGVAPLVVATSLVGFPGLARANELYRIWRAPGPADGGGPGPIEPLPATSGREIAELLPAGAVGFYPLSLAFTHAHGFYAWRTLVAVTRETFGMQLGRVELLGLGEREHYLLLPRDPSPAVEAEIGDVRATLAAKGALSAESAHWELWRLEGD